MKKKVTKIRIIFRKAEIEKCHQEYYTISIQVSSKVYLFCSAGTENDIKVPELKYRVINNSNTCKHKR